jgi:isopentenyl phosphate kinase
LANQHPVIQEVEAWMAKCHRNLLQFLLKEITATEHVEAQIRVAFDKKPDWFPFIEEIKYEGHSIPVVFGDIDASQLARKGYVSYCILSGNLPAAGKIAIKFHYYKTNQTFWMNLNQ